DRAAPEAARLRNRAVRQEPPRRQEPIPADRARLRRVLRQPLPPERRGGARELQLPEGPAVQADVRPTRRAPLPGTETDDPTEQPRWGRVGRQTIEDTGP